MYYTPGQLRDTVGLSKEAFRHWKRVVPAFANGRGHAPSFSPGDVLASAVLRRLTDTAGVRISRLSGIAPAIFSVCNSSGWDALRDKSLVIDLQERSCIAACNPVGPVGDIVVVCALGPLITSLQADLLSAKVRSRAKAVPTHPGIARERKRGAR